MRESIGSSLLMYIVIFFVGVIMLFFVGILSYSKAYRSKNRIVEIVEKYDFYGANAITEINDSLHSIGYSVSNHDYCSSNSVKSYLRSKGIDATRVTNMNSTNYNYCIFRVDTDKTNPTGPNDYLHYYIIVTFVQFDFPVIGDLVRIPVYSETKILGKSYTY